MNRSPERRRRIGEPGGRVVCKAKQEIQEGLRHGMRWEARGRRTEVTELGGPGDPVFVRGQTGRDDHVVNTAGSPCTVP